MTPFRRDHLIEMYHLYRTIGGPAERIFMSAAQPASPILVDLMEYDRNNAMRNKAWAVPTIGLDGVDDVLPA